MGERQGVTLAAIWREEQANRDATITHLRPDRAAIGAAAGGY
jgi:hypothetical protein